MKDQLSAQPKIPETGIINLDDTTENGTQWVGYAIYPKSIIYFDSYGLPLPKAFVNYVSRLNSTGTQALSNLGKINTAY